LFNGSLSFQFQFQPFVRKRRLDSMLRECSGGTPLDD
jgi:hypothetical protein